MTPYKVSFESIPWESPFPGLRARRYARGDTRLRLVEYTREMKPHWCEKGHVGYVLEGRFEITFDGEVVIFDAGDGIFIPPGSAHRHLGKVLSEVVRVIFVEAE